MYAIIKTGGKQLKVEQDRYYDIELLNANVGDKVKFDVLLLNDGKKSTVGTKWGIANHLQELKFCQ